MRKKNLHKYCNKEKLLYVNEHSNVTCDERYSYFTDPLTKDSLLIYATYKSFGFIVHFVSKEYLHFLQ